MVNIITDRKELFGKYEKYKDNINVNINVNIHIFLSVSELKKIIPIKYHQMIDTFDNKKLFNEFMIKNNLENNIPKILVEPNEYPFIVKPKIGLSGNNIKIFAKYSQWKSFKEQYDNENYIIQKYVDSENLYVCHILSDHGNILMSKVYEGKKPYKYFYLTGALTDYTSRNMNSTELLLFSKIIKQTLYHGLCCIDYDYDDDIIKIFEINPRAGGSLIENKKDFEEFLDIMINKSIEYN